MSSIFSKLTDQISRQKPTESQQPSSGLLHKITDAATGQKHPQDYQNQQDQQGNYMPGYPSQFPPNTSGYNGGGYGGQRGGYGEGGHDGNRGGYGGYGGGHDGNRGGYGGYGGGHDGNRGGYGGYGGHKGH